MEVLRITSYVKAKTLTDAKALLMEEVKDAVDGDVPFISHTKKTLLEMSMP